MREVAPIGNPFACWEKKAEESDWLVVLKRVQRIEIFTEVKKGVRCVLAVLNFFNRAYQQSIR